MMGGSDDQTMSDANQVQSKSQSETPGTDPLTFVFFVVIDWAT